MEAIVKSVGLMGILLATAWLCTHVPQAPKVREYERLCYNSNNFKTDYCSKLGKTWRI